MTLNPEKKVTSWIELAQKCKLTGSNSIYVSTKLRNTNKRSLFAYLGFHKQDDRKGWAADVFPFHLVNILLWKLSPGLSLWAPHRLFHKECSSTGAYLVTVDTTNRKKKKKKDLFHTDLRQSQMYTCCNTSFQS